MKEPFVPPPPPNQRQLTIACNLAAALLTSSLLLSCALRVTTPAYQVEEIVESDEFSSETDFAQFHLQLGNEYFRRGMFMEAIVKFRKSLEINPYSPEAQNNLGQSYYRTGRRDLAISRFRRALLLDPTYGPARNNLAVVTDDPAERLRQLRQALDSTPKSATIYNNMCYTFVQMGKLEEGVNECLAAIEADSSDVTAHYNFGSAYQDQGRLDDSSDQYLIALGLAPRNVDALNNLGLVYYHQSKKLLAKTMLGRALRINPRHPVANYNLGLVLEAQGDYTGAADAFELYLRYRREATDAADVHNRVQELRYRSQGAGS